MKLEHQLFDLTALDAGPDEGKGGAFAHAQDQVGRDLGRQFVVCRQMILELVGDHGHQALGDADRQFRAVGHALIHFFAFAEVIDGLFK